MKFYEDNESITYKIRTKDNEVELSFFKGVLDLSFEFNNLSDVDNNIAYIEITKESMREIIYALQDINNRYMR